MLRPQRSRRSRGAHLLPHFLAPLVRVDGEASASDRVGMPRRLLAETKEPEPEASSGDRKVERDAVDQVLLARSALEVAHDAGGHCRFRGMKVDERIVLRPLHHLVLLFERAIHRSIRIIFSASVVMAIGLLGCDHPLFGAIVK